MKISRNLELTTGVSKILLRKKLAKCELDDLTRNPEECITKLKLLILYLRKLDVQIYNFKTMTHILSNLPEKYQNIPKFMEDKLDDDYDPLTIKIIHDKLLVKYDLMKKNKTKNFRMR